MPEGRIQSLERIGKHVYLRRPDGTTEKLPPPLYYWVERYNNLNYQFVMAERDFYPNLAEIEHVDEDTWPICAYFYDGTFCEFSEKAYNRLKKLGVL